jgi:two-component system cell cycle sensor histidine kinase/response regulator CckA
MSAITSPATPPSRTILLVEDEDSVRQITRYVLESAGYLVLEASSSEHAIALCHSFQGSINLLLTDVVMPNMNGAELAARLKQTRPEITTMFMSGYARNAGLSKGRLGSPDYYLQKPFSTGMLLSRVAEALSLPANGREAITEIMLPF